MTGNSHSKFAVVLTVIGLVTIAQAYLRCYEGENGQPAGHAVGCYLKGAYCYVSGVKDEAVKERGCGYPMNGENIDRSKPVTCEWSKGSESSECKCFEDYCNKQDKMVE